MDDFDIINNFIKEDEEKEKDKTNKINLPKNKEEKETQLKLLKLRNELLTNQLDNKEKTLMDYRKKCGEQTKKINELKKKVTKLLLEQNIENNTKIKYEINKEPKKINNKKEALIDKIETIEYNIDKATFFQCGICMDSFNEFEKVKRLQCKHIFHIDCMSQWLQTKKNCPFCDQIIFY